MSGDAARAVCTRRLRLRPWTSAPADLARLADIYGRTEVTRWLGGPPTVSPAVLVEHWAAISAEDDRYGCWAIEPRDGGAPAGTLLLKPLPQGVGEVEVVVATGPAPARVSGSERRAGDGEEPGGGQPG